jgi:hypothetical protein
MAPGAGGGGEMPPDQRAFEALRKEGGLEAMGLPADLSFAEFQRGQTGEGDVLAALEIWATTPPVNPALAMIALVRLLRQQRREAQIKRAAPAMGRYVRQIADVDMGFEPGAGTPPPPPEGVQPVTRESEEGLRLLRRQVELLEKIAQQRPGISTGTVIIGGDPRRVLGQVRMGSSRGDIVSRTR